MHIIIQLGELANVTTGVQVCLAVQMDIYEDKPLSSIYAVTNSNIINNETKEELWINCHSNLQQLFLKDYDRQITPQDTNINLHNSSTITYYGT